ncbi:MAG: hypothetical protein EZS28_051805, partial [Streblomastix strix]
QVTSADMLAQYLAPLVVSNEFTYADGLYSITPDVK